MADLKTTALLAENARLNGDLDAIAVAMGLANEHEGHVQRAGIERLCEDALAARRAESMLADVQTENARLRAVAEAAGELVSESRRGGCSCTQRWRSEESTASSCACCDAERDVSAALTALEAP